MVHTNSLKPYQKPLKLILPGEHTFYGLKPFFKNCLTKKSLATTLRFFSVSLVEIDVWNHASIKNLLPIGSAIIHAIKAHKGPFEVYSYWFC